MAEAVRSRTKMRSRDKAELVQIREALEPAMEMLNRRMDERHEENRRARHDQAGRIDSVSNQLFSLTKDVSVLQHRVQAIDGGDTGHGGVLEKLQAANDRIEGSIAELRSDVRSIRDSSPSNPQVRGLEDWRNKWLGVVTAISILATIFTLIGGVITVMTILMHHTK